jgi:hypothetical protein
VGKGKRVDAYLEVRKRRGHIFFEDSGVKLKPPTPPFHAKCSVPYAYMYDIFENYL